MGALHHMSNHFLNQMGFLYHSSDRTEKIGINKSAGVGFVLRMMPRPDMLITLTNITLAENNRVKFYFGDAMVELLICLQGEGEVQVSGKYHQLRPDTLSLRFMDRAQGDYQFIGGQPMITLGIHIPVATFNHFLQGINGTTTIDFHHLLGSRSLQQYQQSLSVATSQIARQLIHAPNSNLTRNIAVECKALELLSLSISHFLFDHDLPNYAYSITKSDLEKIHQARDVILNQMESPPSLLELSRLINLNDYKLKIGFKEVFGMTVFDYLREKRLEKAMLHLQNGQISVSEVAASVGYTNASYFAKAFRKQYGINPSELIRRSPILL